MLPGSESGKPEASVRRGFLEMNLGIRAENDTSAVAAFSEDAFAPGDRRGELRALNINLCLPHGYDFETGTVAIKIERSSGLEKWDIFISNRLPSGQ